MEVEFEVSNVLIPVFSRYSGILFYCGSVIKRIRLQGID